MAQAKIPRPTGKLAQLPLVDAGMEAERARQRMQWFEEILEKAPSRIGEAVIVGLKAMLLAAEDEVLVAKPKICSLCHTEIRGGHCKCV